MDIQLATSAVDPALCPICGRPNGCRLAADGPSPEPCWCTLIEISEKVLRLVPAAAIGRACVCRQCVETYSRAG